MWNGEVRTIWLVWGGFLEEATQAEIQELGWTKVKMDHEPRRQEQETVVS